MKQYDKNTPIQVLKETYIAAKIKDGQTEEEARASFDAKLDNPDKMNDLYQ